MPDCALMLMMAHLDDRELAQSMAVCRKFRQSAHQVALERFSKRWNVTLAGEPGPVSAYLRATEYNFSVKHVLGRRDTCESLALRFGLCPTEIKRKNNIISDATVASRLALYLPWPSPATLSGKVVRYEYDHNAKRAHFVVTTDLPPSSLQPSRTPGHVNPPGSLGVEPPPDGTRTTPPRPETIATSRHGRQRAVAVLRAALSIDVSTAEYYLDCAGGNLRKAREMYAADKDWEEQQGAKLGRQLRSSMAGNVAGQLVGALAAQFATGIW